MVPRLCAGSRRMDPGVCATGALNPLPLFISHRRGRAAPEDQAERRYRSAGNRPVFFAALNLTRSTPLPPLLAEFGFCATPPLGLGRHGSFSSMRLRCTGERRFGGLFSSCLAG